ncbi:MAG: Xylose isomerase-like TIM barrel [Lentisphaerae bacterium ADurb.Bin242]|nr:MAG: Xylose isomerase-like TIM barrel [Lentisphaerae bacterium ADurb.Bin242]
MKISCTPISFQKTFKAGQITWEQFFEVLADNHCDGVDLLDSQCYPWFFRNYKDEKKTVQKKLAELDLHVAAYACGNNFAKFAPEAHSHAVGAVINAIREAAEFGAQCLRIFGGHHESSGGEPGMTYAPGLKLVVRGIESCIKEAEKNNVVLALENHGRLPGLSDEMLTIVKHFDSPFVRINFDVSNFQPGIRGESEDPLDAYEKLKPYIVHCHVKDLALELRDGLIYRMPAVAGEGGLVPLRRFAYALERDGYNGYCSLEYEAATPEMTGVSKSLAYLDELKAAAKLIAGGF